MPENFLESIPATKKCAAQHCHHERKLCELMFVTTPPPVHLFVPPSCGPCNFQLEHFRGNTCHTNLQWIEKVSNNVSKMHLKITKYTKMPHLHDTTRYADLTHILPLQGKKVLSSYNWAGPWPRNQGKITLEALHPESRSAILKEIMKVFSNYKSSQRHPTPAGPRRPPASSTPPTRVQIRE